MSATDLNPIFKRFTTPTLTKLVKLEDDKDVIKMAIFNEDVKEFVKIQNNLNDNIRKLYSVTWRQCRKLMRSKLIGLKQFESIDSNNDATSFLMEIKDISYEYKGYRNPYLALDDAKIALYIYYQKTNESNTLHCNTFQALVEAVEHHRINLYCDDALILQS